MKNITPSQRLESMPISAIRKLIPYSVEAKKQGVKVFHLNLGDPDIKTPEVMINALRNWNINPIGYAPSAGTDSFLKALEWYYHKLGFPFINTSHIIATIGGSEGIGMSMFGVANPGDEIIVFEPFYSSYASSAAIYGVKLVPVETHLENGFHLPNRKAIEAKITEKTRAIFYCNPGNPTGAVYEKEEIEMLVSIVKEHNLFLISDEVYREYVFEGRVHTSLLHYMQEIPEQAILLDSLSKRYSLCGGRLGVYLTLNKNLIQLTTRIAMTRLSGGIIDQAVGAKLTEVPDSYISDVQKEYQNRRDFLYEGLKKIPGVTVNKPEGAFYTMVGLPVENAEDFCIWLLQKYRSHNETVMFAPGAGFYATPGKGTNEIRIAYVLNTNDLARCLEMLKDALEKYRENS